MGQPSPVPLSSAATPSLSRLVSKGALLQVKSTAYLPKELLPAVFLHIASPSFQNQKLRGL